MAANIEPKNDPFKSLLRLPALGWSLAQHRLALESREHDFPHVAGPMVTPPTLPSLVHPYTSAARYLATHGTSLLNVQRATTIFVDVVAAPATGCDIMSG